MFWGISDIHKQICFKKVLLLIFCFTLFELVANHICSPFLLFKPFIKKSWPYSKMLSYTFISISFTEEDYFQKINVTFSTIRTNEPSYINLEFSSYFVVFF